MSADVVAIEMVQAAVEAAVQQNQRDEAPPQQREEEGVEPQIAVQAAEPTAPMPTSGAELGVPMEGDTPSLRTIKGTDIPVLVFLNSGSGGRQGGRLLARFEQWVGKEQVYDLGQVKSGGAKPEAILQKFAHVKNLRVVACGGDGTCCWILSAMDKVPACRVPVGTMPLGTGNDLSRALGWGPGFTRAMGKESWLQLVGRAQPTPLDRWSCMVSLPGGRMPPTFTATGEGSAQSGVFCNYLGIGIEAASLNAFHEAREANPKVFNGRIKNQVKMGLLGVGKSGLCPLFCGSAPQLAPRLSVQFRRRESTEWEELALPSRLKTVILVNIPSHAAGRNLWGKHSSRGATPQSFSDGVLEMTGFHSAGHFGCYLALSQPGSLLGCSRQTGSTRLAQVAELKIELKEPLHMQMDGEPWLQPQSTVHISHSVASMMLQASAMGCVQCGGTVHPWRGTCMVLSHGPTLVSLPPRPCHLALAA